MNAIFLGIVVVGMVALGYKFIIMPVLLMNKQLAARSKVCEIMAKDGLSFEDAKDKLLTEKIAKIVEVENYCYELEGRKMKMGDRISFYNSDEKNYTVGNFVGTRNSASEGYTEHMCIKTVDGKIKFFPVEIIDTDTLKIYER
ncbi:hypothetical protein [Clostridium magnum]|uniref:Uncharacterized protein n=1 Tax=Clostridium magnum DSM 2767 TaxID=1121326 RepID=A0A162TLA3_9CLOT|nr:hypothetical protein [Clostridium magnum]KZL92790.1 hypothetical protein CLMAG_26040 [Clostridium magnum DSM 2767]SHJ40424.1 hypothetical protein SAMN02745944_05900 [Clostridium magnum DSM 2767]